MKPNRRQTFLKEKLKIHYKRCRYISLVLFAGSVAFIQTGCASDYGDDKSPYGLELIPLNGSGLPQETINNLKIAAKQGDGKAAYDLYGYYSIMGDSDTLANYYLEMAVRLDCPDALYMKALLIWEFEDRPNFDKVERLVRRAIQLGRKDDKRLLDEVLEAKRTGQIPSNSQIRQQITPKGQP